MRTFDLIVLGAGSAGFAAAIKAAEAGRSVALVEGGTIGGTCVNVGCVPSKTLIAAANLRQEATRPPFQGLGLRSEPVDFAAVMAEKDDLVATLRQEKYVAVLEAYPLITWVPGRGVVRHADPVVLAVGDELLQAPRLVVATGAHSWAPPIPGLAETPYWTSTEALAATRLPRDLIVLGGSAVGLEIGQLFHRLGTHVTVLEALDRIVPPEDPEVSRALEEFLEAEGLRVETAVDVQAVQHTDGQFVVNALVGGHAQEFRAERLLVATGRRPTTAGFGLEAVGVQLNRRGGITVTPRMQSTVPTIYAAGDVVGDAMFVYVAAEAGAVAATNALGLGERVLDLTALPKVTFTDPQVASVGYSEALAEQAGIPTTVTTLPLAYVPRALANRDTRGFIKLVAEAGTERIVGLHVVAPDAGEIIQIGTIAVKYEMTVEDLTSLFFPYLTMGEGVKLAALTFHKDVTKLSCCAGS
jgi:mercuric reductase